MDRSDPSPFFPSPKAALVFQTPSRTGPSLDGFFCSFHSPCWPALLDGLSVFKFLLTCASKILFFVFCFFCFFGFFCCCFFCFCLFGFFIFFIFLSFFFTVPAFYFYVCVCLYFFLSFLMSCLSFCPTYSVLLFYILMVSVSWLLRLKFFFTFDLFRRKTLTLTLTLCFI